jgi:hypothetical protein
MIFKRKKINESNKKVGSVQNQKFPKVLTIDIFILKDVASDFNKMPKHLDLDK